MRTGFEKRVCPNEVGLITSPTAYPCDQREAGDVGVCRNRLRDWGLAEGDEHTTLGLLVLAIKRLSWCAAP
jgi:hypothetical protein